MELNTKARPRRRQQAPNGVQDAVQRDIDNDMVLLQVPKEQYGAEYQDHLMKEYQLCVEMADRISARRILTHGFFVTINASFVAAMAVIYKEGGIKPQPWMIGPVMVLLAFCFTWWFLVRSYQRLNNAKYSVIVEIEKSLPCAPYAAEWKVLDAIKGASLHMPLTNAESLIPLLFGVLYAALAVLILITGFRHPEAERALVSWLR